MPVAPELHSVPTPPAPPADMKGVWMPLQDAGDLISYIHKLKGKCQEDDVIIDRGNEYLKKH